MEKVDPATSSEPVSPTMSGVTAVQVSDYDVEAGVAKDCACMQIHSRSCCAARQDH